MPPKAVKDDKTFGMKNKNKSAKVQKTIATIKQQQSRAGKSPADLLKEKEKQDKLDEKARLEAKKKMEAELFRPAQIQKVAFGTDPKTVLCVFFKAGHCEKGNKCKFSHDPNVERKAAKVNIYEDTREKDALDKTKDDMAGWDEEKLRDVVEQQSKRQTNATDIVCKFFIQAIEDKKYGWFWECPGGGDKCHYRHALPPGFVLKADKKKAEEEAKKEQISLADFLEVERHKLKQPLTPVTPETFAVWKKTRVEKKQAEAEAMEKAKASQRAMGKMTGMTGKDMFDFGGELYEDDEEAEEDDWDISRMLARYRAEEEEQEGFDRQARIDEEAEEGNEKAEEEKEVDGVADKGGTVLTKLLALPTPPSTITVLVRSADKAPLFEQLAVPSGTTIKVLLGSLEEHDKLTKAASEADVVLNTASADDLAGIKALMAGMKQRKEKTGHRSLFIQTSGTGVMIDDAKGEYANDIIYTDLNPTPKSRDAPALLSFEEIPSSAPHREVDIAINEGDAKGDFKSYIILPSTIWGPGKGEVYDKGISNSFSDQMPTLSRIALDRGVAGIVGKGANIWPHVNISDIGDLFALVYQRAPKGDIGHGKSGFYLGIAGEYTLLAAGQAIGQALVENKFSDKPQPTSLSEDEMKKYYGGSYYMGSNSRGKADRSKSIGWRPKLTDERDFLRAVREETVRAEKVYGRKLEEATKKVY